MTERRPFDPAELARDVRPAWDAARVERALDEHLRARRRRASMRAGGVAVAAAAALALVWQAWPEPAPLAEHREAPALDPRVVELADGSRFSPIEGAVLTMHEVTEARVRAELTAGAVDVDIVPRLGREVRIEVGAVTVTVLGTAFRVTRHDATPNGPEVEVAVRRGLVAVDYDERGVARRTVLGAGESGRFPPLAPPEPASEPAARATPLERPRRPREEAPIAEPIPVEAPPPPSWRELAERGAFEDAYTALDRAGPAEAPRDPEGLLLAADAARLSGHPREALAFLERAEADAAGDPRAPLAAFSSGRILSQLGRHADAAAAFERVLALEPGGSLAEDAMVRAAEAHDRAGHADAAHALARRYLEAHPDGRGGPRMRALAP